jgi:hypothetical protein
MECNYRLAWYEYAWACHGGVGGVGYFFHQNDQKICEGADKCPR